MFFVFLRDRGERFSVENVKRDKIHLTEQEKKIFEILRNLDYGEVRVIVKNGTPVHVEEIKKSIKL